MSNGAYVAKPNTAGIFPNEKRSSETHPHFRGTIELGDDLLAELFLASKAGRPAKLDVAMYKAMSKAGKAYLNMRVAKAWEPSGGQQPQQREPVREQVAHDDIPF
jgi:hypothetical protein